MRTKVKPHKRKNIIITNKIKMNKIKRATLLILSLFIVCIMHAQDEIVEHLCCLPDSTAETIFSYAKEHDIDSINGTTVVLWHPYACIEAKVGDEYLGMVPVSFWVHAQDFTLKNGEAYDNGKSLLYIPVAPATYELTEVNKEIISRKLKAPFVLGQADKVSFWKKDKFKVMAHDEWILGERNMYVTYHCVTYPKRYIFEFAK